MRTISTRLGVLLVSALASPAVAGFTVPGYVTSAWTSTFGSQGSASQVLENISPAFAEVSGDWMGTNAGGSTITSRWVGSAQTTSTTVFYDPNLLMVTGSGSFAHQLTTTAEFIDPSSSTTSAPYTQAAYACTFILDDPATYVVTAQLNQWSSVFLLPRQGDAIFIRVNTTTTPAFVEIAGTLPPGEYDFFALAAVGAPRFPNGVNHYAASGSFEDLMFGVQVPEPNALALLSPISGKALRRRRRCARAP